MSEQNKLIKWYIKVLFKDGSAFFGYASSNFEKSDDAIHEIIGDKLNPFLLMTKNGNGVVIINPVNVSAIYFYNNENYED